MRTTSRKPGKGRERPRRRASGVRPIEREEVTGVTRVETPAARRSRPPSDEVTVPRTPIPPPAPSVDEPTLPRIPEPRPTQPVGHIDPRALPFEQPEGRHEPASIPSEPPASVSPWHKPVEVAREALPSSLMPAIDHDPPVDEEGRLRARRAGLVVWLTIALVAVIAALAVWLAA